MEFSQKEIKRAIRDFQSTIHSLQAAGHNVYSTRVKELITLITQNRVVNSIVGPYLVMDIDFNSIENEGGGWFELQLPAEQDLQIAYALQVMKRASEGEYDIETYAFNIFRQRRLNDNISNWNRQILFPCLDNLVYKLNDLIEDEVDGKDQIEAGSLQIINYGSISAEQGNIAVGKDITQTLNVGELVDELIEKAIEQGIINQSQVGEVKATADEIQNELEKNTPSKGKLQELASNIYDIGSKGLLSLSTNIISDPRWGEAVTGFLFGLV
jgi:hypothetical protein